MTEDLGDVIKPVRVKLLDENEWHDIRRDNSLNELGEIQEQISQIWESITALLSRIEEIEKTVGSSEDG